MSSPRKLHSDSGTLFDGLFGSEMELDTNLIFGGSRLIPDALPSSSSNVISDSDPNRSSSALSNKQDSPSVERLHSYIVQLNARLQYVENIVVNSFQSQAFINPMGTMGASFPQRTDEIRVRDLDDMIEPHFLQTPAPTNIQLNNIVKDVEPRLMGYERKKISAAIRKWYRKRRDEEGQKVFAACVSHLQPLINTKEDADSVKIRIQNEDDDLYKLVFSASQLDMTNEKACHEFFEQKVDAFFNRRIYK